MGAPDGQDPLPMHIVVPHLDPGYVSYGSGDTRILRVMLLTWCRTLCLISCCMQLANETPGYQDNERTRDFCLQAINMLTDIENQHGFTEVFDEASTEMQNIVHETARSKS